MVRGHVRRHGRRRRLVVLTEWNAFRALDLERVRKLLRRPIVVDLRNIYEPAEMIAAGFSYSGIGRPVPI